jgi:hypothetical protein
MVDVRTQVDLGRSRKAFQVGRREPIPPAALPAAVEPGQGRLLASTALSAAHPDHHADDRVTLRTAQKGRLPGDEEENGV